MAVIGLEDIQYEPWGGFRDRRLPERIWKGKVATTGDLTGGTLSSFLRFNPSGSERLDLYFSLEEIYVRNSSAATATVMLFETRNFGSFKTGIRFVSLILDVILTDAGVAQSARTKSAIPPIFMGQQVFTGTAQEIVLVEDNVNGQLTDLWAGGYVWGPRSASAPDGGLLRPNPGLFGNR